MGDSEDVKQKYAEIAALKRAIEQQKMESTVSPYPTAPSYRGRGRGRGGYRGGYRSARPTTYRNMTYVLNDRNKEDTNSRQNSYVSRYSKGGMSLVNAEIYHQDQQKFQASQQAQIAMQLKMKEQRRLINLRSRVAKYRAKTDGCDRVEIDGDKFAVTRLGNRLVPITVPQGDKSRSATWDGRTYARKHNGVLKCFGGRKKRIPTDHCRYFTRTGICQKGSACTYQHDKSRIRICRQYLLNRCYDKNCLLSHDCNEHNTPICKYHLERKCTNAQCWFQHWKPKSYDEPHHEIWVCRQFAVGGWCGRGTKCPFLHVFTCPDFEEDGSCPKGNSCPLTHRATKRHQDLMATPKNKYVAPSQEEEEVVVESDNEEDGPTVAIVSSYTVDPEFLFVSSEDSRYDVYVDGGSKEESPANTSTFSENSQFLIVDDSSSESDELEGNTDFIHF